MRNFRKFSKITLSLILIIVLSVISMRAIFPAKYIDYVTEYSAKSHVDSHLVFALIKAESNFNITAQSTVGAKGIMQLTEATFDYFAQSTGADYTPQDIFDTGLNIRAGVWYLSKLLQKYDGNITNAIAAYNAGGTNVDKWLCDKDCSTDGKTLTKIPFGETARYTKKVARYYKIYKALYPLI